MKTASAKWNSAARPVSVLELLRKAGVTSKLGKPTALLFGANFYKKKKALELLAFFADRKGALVEYASMREGLIRLREDAADTILGGTLPRSAVAPVSLEQRLGWGTPKGTTTTLHALTTAFAPLLQETGLARCRATWVSMRLQPEVSHIALHTESGALLLQAAIPTPVALVYPSLGLGFWWKILLLAVLLALLAFIISSITSGGPLTWSALGAAAAIYKFGLFVAALDLIILLIDLLIELWEWMFPNNAAKLNRLRGISAKAKRFRADLEAKKEGGQDLEASDRQALTELIDDVRKEADEFGTEIEDKLNGAPPAEKAELEKAKKYVDRIKEALRELEKFRDAISE